MQLCTVISVRHRAPSWHCDVGANCRKWTTARWQLLSFPSSFPCHGRFLFPSSKGAARPIHLKQEPCQFQPPPMPGRAMRLCHEDDHRTAQVLKMEAPHHRMAGTRGRRGMARASIPKQFSFEKGRPFREGDHGSDGDGIHARCLGKAWPADHATASGRHGRPTSSFPWP